MMRNAATRLWLLAFVLLSLAAGCCRQDRQPAIQRIQHRGTLLVGTTGDYRPLSFREDDGTYWGFCIDMAGEIAKRLGVEVAFVPTSWPTLTNDVLAEPQAFDLAIGGITITDARCETMSMSEGYLSNGKTFICRASDAGRYQTLSDLDKPEVRVLVNPGGLNEQFARENLPQATLLVHSQNAEIPKMVAEGEADVMITEITEAPWYIEADKRLAAPLLDKPFTHSEVGVLMRRGQDDLMNLVNETIADMKADGSLRCLHEKYGLVYAYGGVKSKELFRTSQSWDGAELPDYPVGRPELVAIRYEFGPGQKLSLHSHPVLNFGVLVQGELTIIDEEGHEKTVHAGEGVVEMVGTIHHGENRGKETGVLYMFYASQEGMPLSVPATEQ